MNILAIMLDGESPPEWLLFQWCICFPILTITLSWALVRWEKNLVVLALAIASVATGLLINQLYADIRFRAEWKSRFEAMLQVEERNALASKAEPESLQMMRQHVRTFDHQTFEAIPPYSRRMIMAVWFAALFPFIPIIAFYFSAVNPAKLQKSLPASDSSSP